MLLTKIMLLLTIMGLLTTVVLISCEDFFFYNGSDCGSLLKNDRDVDLTMLVDLGDLQLLF